jgi:hypothetical protein
LVWQALVIGSVSFRKVSGKLSLSNYLAFNGYVHFRLRQVSKVSVPVSQSFLVLVKVKGSCNNVVSMAVESFSGLESGVRESPPTKRAMDGGESAASRSIFLPSGFFCSQA